MAQIVREGKDVDRLSPLSHHGERRSTSASPAASFSRPAGSISIRSGARNSCRASTRVVPRRAGPHRRSARFAMAAGARYGTGAMSHAFWAPVSVRKRADGSTAAFPHFVMDRGKPGMLAVDRARRAFRQRDRRPTICFGLAMQAAPGEIGSACVPDRRRRRAAASRASAWCGRAGAGSTRTSPRAI